MSRPRTYVPVGFRFGGAHLLLFATLDRGPYHAVREGWIPGRDELGLEVFCHDARLALGGLPDGHAPHGWIEGPNEAMEEIIRALRICERMCTECADHTVGALHPNGATRARIRIDARARR